MKEGLIMAGAIVDLGNNKWELRVSLGYDMNGKQMRKTRRITARSRQAADKELAKFYVEVTNKPVTTGKKISFSEFSIVWENRHNSKLSNTTQFRNTELLNLRILPAFYKKQLDRISANDIIRFIDTLRQAGMRKDGQEEKLLSDGSIQMHYKLLRSMFNKAVQWHYISQNPCSLIPKDSIPRANYRRLPIWQENDLKRFLATIEALEDSPINVKYKLMISLALLTGARRGEFMALTWDCIDFTNKTIYINKACEVISHQPVNIKSPKTASSVRHLGIDDYTISLLMRHKYIQDEYLKKKNLNNPKQFIFLARIQRNTNELSQAFPSCLYTWLKRFCTKYKFPKITVHSFRHMAATYALSYGVPLTTVQHMLGHTDIKTTSIYLHELESKRQEATKILSSQYNLFRTNQ